jgi:hypothetical protein
MRKKVYIAGPLNAKNAAIYLDNVKNMNIIAAAVYDAGFSPYIPGNDFFFSMFVSNMEYEDYIQLNMPWVVVSDAILVINHSPGTDREIDMAEAWGIPVFYNIEELKEYFYNQPPFPVDKENNG